MSQVGDLEGFESLHRDLLALSESRLSNIDRLWVQLEARITDFRRLLDKNARSEQSRKALASGMLPQVVFWRWENAEADVHEVGRLHVQDDEYAINEEFQQNALQVADALDLDELESARLLLAAQDDAVALGRSAMESSIIRFHQTRKYLLDCLRLVLQTSEDMDAEQQIREAFDDVVGRIVQAQERGGQGQKFVPRCLQHMNQIKAQLQDLVDKLNGASVLGQVQRPDILDTIEFQRVSLVQQHESLGTIVHFLIKKNHSTSADFEQVLDTLRRFDKYDNLLGMFHTPRQLFQAATNLRGLA
jgi:nuclear pore complex protein Nup205